MADFDNGVGQALEQAVKNIQARMEQIVADMLPRLVQTAVVNAVNEYAAVRETGEAERFKAHMAHLYPILDQLGRRPETDDKPGTSEHPEVAMMIPSDTVGGEAVAGWGQYLPFGDKDGQVLAWNKEDESWDPGEVAGGAYDGEFALYLDEDEQVLKVKRGTVCINGWRESFQNDITVGNVGNISNSTVQVYLCAYQRLDNAGNPVREVRYGLPVRFTALVETSSSGDGVRGYIKLGEYSKWRGIVQEYRGGTGAQITIKLESGGYDNQILKWNAETETWQPGWVTAVTA